MWRAFDHSVLLANGRLQVPFTAIFTRRVDASSADMARRTRVRQSIACTGGGLHSGCRFGIIKSSQLASLHTIHATASASAPRWCLPGNPVYFMYPQDTNHKAASIVAATSKALHRCAMTADGTPAYTVGAPTRCGQSRTSIRARRFAVFIGRFWVGGA